MNECNQQPYKNDDIRTTIKEICKLDQYTDKVPAVISKDVQLTLDVNPNNSRQIVIFDNGYNGGSVTLDSTRDFYMTHAWISSNNYSSPGTGGVDSIYVYINGTPNNVLRSSIQSGTLTDSLCNSVSITFPIPIKIDRGTTVVFQIINSQVGLGFGGYYVDPNTYDMGILAQQQAYGGSK